MTPEEAVTDPAKLAFALGELTGTVKQVIDQRDTEHRENKDRFDSLDGTLAAIREHGTGAAAQVALDLKEHVAVFDKFVEKCHDPLVRRTEKLERWRLILVGAWLATSTLFSCVIVAAKLWHDFLS